MNYGKRQERAERLVKRFRELAVARPNEKSQGLTWAEIERQTEWGRGTVKDGEIVLRALAKGPPP